MTKELLDAVDEGLLRSSDWWVLSKVPAEDANRWAARIWRTKDRTWEARYSFDA